MKNLPPYVNIEGEGNLIRDTFSMGVLNTNSVALEYAQRRKKEALVKLGNERRKDAEINTLRKDVNELKKLVNQLIERKGTT